MWYNEPIILFLEKDFSDGMELWCYQVWIGNKEWAA